MGERRVFAVCHQKRWIRQQLYLQPSFDFIVLVQILIGIIISIFLNYFKEQNKLGPRNLTLTWTYCSIDRNPIWWIFYMFSFFFFFWQIIMFCYNLGDFMLKFVSFLGAVWSCLSLNALVWKRLWLQPRPNGALCWFLDCESIFTS